MDNGGKKQGSISNILNGHSIKKMFCENELKKQI
jgi:hypothetical protein